MLTFGFTIHARKEHTPSRLLFPTYQGEFLGQVEGETLWIDTIGLDPTNEISYCDKPSVGTLDLTPPRGGYVPPGA